MEPAPREFDSIPPLGEIDLYCLECGYNLRGLSGDPRRCPECFHLNPVGEAELSAEMPRSALKFPGFHDFPPLGSAALGCYSVKPRDKKKQRHRLLPPQSGIPMCGDCGDDMELAPLAALENPTPGAGDTIPNGVKIFVSLDHVDWDLLYDQKLALIECLESKRVTPGQAEHLGGILHLRDAWQDDAESAGRWTHPDAEPS